MALRLHIGTHKTGTTLLQRFAHQNRARLRAGGLEYPDWKEWLGIRGHYAHHDLAHAIGENSKRVGPKELDRFWGIMREYARDHDVLVSAEPFYRYLIAGESGPKKAHATYVQRLGHWARDVEVEVVLVLRKPDDFAVSMYGEHVLQTRFGGALDRFIREKGHLFDYAWQIGLFEKNVGPVRHLCYEGLCEQDLVNAFFAELGLDVSGWDRPSLANTSKDPALVELKRRANSAPGGVGDNRAYLRKLARTSVEDVLSNEQGTRPRTLWQTQDEERAFLHGALEKFSESQYWDEAKYGRWRAEPAQKTYMAQWLADMKDLQALGEGA